MPVGNFRRMTLFALFLDRNRLLRFFMKKLTDFYVLFENQVFQVDTLK
ncbi:MAG: hypothetical protein ACJAYJ_004301 [Saprospiraceae bacterium]|jgi:hypothetical protein